MRLKTIALCGAALLLAGTTQAAELSRKPFGTLPSGESVEALTLTNGNGVSATVITYGATLQSLIAPGRDGKTADVALGFTDAAGYASNNSYFGASVGRFANRIGKGRFSLDGKTYQLALNNDGVAALAVFCSAPRTRRPTDGCAAPLSESQTVARRAIGDARLPIRNAPPSVATT